MQMPMWLLPSQWAFAAQSGQGRSTHSSSSPHARWSGQSESVMHSERLDMAKWWIQMIKSVLLTYFAAFITWVACTNAYVIACLTVSINCTLWTTGFYTLSFFSTCKVIRAVRVGRAWYHWNKYNLINVQVKINAGWFALNWQNRKLLLILFTHLTHFSKKFLTRLIFTTDLISMPKNRG